MVTKVDVTTACSISAEDMANIQKLRDLVKDELTPFYDTDFNLLRWLQGHDHNIDVVVPKLKHHLAMRKSCLQLDHLTDHGLRNHPLSMHHEYIVTTDSGRIPDCVVCVERVGQIDFWGIVQTYPINEFIKLRIYGLERLLRVLMAKEAETGRQHSILAVFDLAGFKLDSRMLALMKSGARRDFLMDHYVELFHTMVGVNLPSLFYVFFSIMKPLIPEKMLRKIKFCGGSHWHQEVLKMANPEALPAYWNENGEKRFLAEVREYSPVEESKYYVPEKSAKEEYSTLVVKAGKQGKVEVVAEKGKTLRWKFEADGHYDFSVHFHVSAEDNNDQHQPKQLMVYPLLKMPGPTFVPTEDGLVCDASGIFTLCFSNEHAWWHTLKIRYRTWTE